MSYFKKLFFAPFFLITFGGTVFYLQPFFESPVNMLFSFELQSLVNLLILAGLILLASFFYTLLASLSQNWKMVLPVSLIAGLIPLTLVEAPISFILGVSYTLILLLNFTSLDRKLKTYITFQPTTLLIPSIRQLTTLTILVLAFGFYLNASQYVKQKGFEIPDSLIDTTLKFMAPSSIKVQGAKYYAQLPQLKPEEIEYLRKNPQLLQERGIDPKILDTVTKSPAPSVKAGSSANPKNSSSESEKSSNDESPTSSLYKGLIKDQLKKMVDPYLKFIPPLLAILFFFGVQSFSSILSLFLTPLVSLIFYLLEQTGFITFQKEMREVKKMVV